MEFSQHEMERFVGGFQVRTVHFLECLALSGSFGKSCFFRMIKRFRESVGADIEDLIESCTYFYFCTTVERRERNDIATPPRPITVPEARERAHSCPPALHP